MIPPASSALDLYLEPKIFPTFTPAAERMKVVIPMKLAARMMFTSRKAKVIPTARASILVATASGNIFLLPFLQPGRNRLFLWIPESY